MIVLQRLRSGSATEQSGMHSEQVGVTQAQSPTFSIEPEESMSIMIIGGTERMSGP